MRCRGVLSVIVKLPEMHIPPWYWFRTGANFGQCAVYLENTDAVASSHTFIINGGELNPFLLAVYLNTRHGRKMIDRGMYGGVQPELAPYFLRQIPVPDWNEIQSEIESVYLKSHSLIQLSKSKYAEAQNMLLSELGLEHWSPKSRKTFVKSFSETQRIGRVDADYFQPKYEDVVSAIKNLESGWETLGNLVTMRKCTEVGSAEYLEDGIPFVRVSNLRPFEITEEKYISEDLYLALKQHQPEQGEILFSKDATPGIAHYLGEKPKKMIPSSGILRLRSKTNRIDGENLTLALNSMLTKVQATRDAGGSVILHWRPEQIEGMNIPVLRSKLQADIRQRVNESSDLHQRSKRLLYLAKQAVEMAIEQDEQVAMTWLDRECANL